MQSSPKFQSRVPVPHSSGTMTCTGSHFLVPRCCLKSYSIQKNSNRSYQFTNCSSCHMTIFARVYINFIYLHVLTIPIYTMMMTSSHRRTGEYIWHIPLLSQHNPTSGGVYLTQEWCIFLNWWSTICQKVGEWDYVVNTAVCHYAWPPNANQLEYTAP